MFLSSIERENKLYELKDYDLASLCDVANAGKLLALDENGELVAVNMKEEKGVAEVNGIKYATLQEAFDAVLVSDEVKLIDDLYIDTMIKTPKGTEITLNLNNHSIFAAPDMELAGGIIAVVNGSTLIVDGDGMVYGASSTPFDVMAAFMVTTKDTYDASLPARLIINNGKIYGDIYAICGNGMRENTEIIINGGDLVDLLGTGSAIFNPQPNSKVIINRGVLKGGTGIEMRAGELIVNGGIIESITAPTSVNPNGSGTTTLGSAIAVAQHTTKKDLNIVVNGGIIKGYHALHQSNPQKNDVNAVALVNMTINKGTFISTNGGNMPVYSENKEKFVVGGTFVPAIDEKYMA